MFEYHLPLANPPKAQARQLAFVGRRSHREYDRHRLGQQPSRGEGQDLDGGAVHPLRVVDHAQQGLILRNFGQKTERGEPDQETIRGIAERETERDAQRVSLWPRESVEPREHRSQKLVEAGEWQLHLRLDSGDLNDLETAGLTHHTPQQSRLPDARLAVYDQYPALSPSDVLEQPVQSIEFAGPAAERRRALDGHGPRSVKEPGSSPEQSRAQWACAWPRTVDHDCQVIRRITSVMPRPIRGSATGKPSATTIALAITPRLT